MTESRKSTTPFYRLDALAGWRQSPVSESILQDPVLNHLRLGRPGDFPVPPNEPFGSFGGMTLPRGITINADGQVLLVGSFQRSHPLLRQRGVRTVDV